MAIRIDVTSEGRIEVMRPREDARAVFMYFDDLDRAMLITRYLVSRDRAEARGERFVSQFEKEARAIYEQYLTECENGK